MSLILKIMLGVFLGSSMSWLAYIFFIDLYTQAQIEAIDEQLVADAQMKQKEAQKLELAKKDIKASAGMAACKLTIKAHHKKANVNFTETVRTTETFTAINYTLNNERYHAQCYIAFDSNTVTKFKTDKV